MSEISEGAISERFRNYLPVVIDVETGGFNCQTDALLEIAAVPVLMDIDGNLITHETLSHSVVPFPGANLEPSALQFTGIDPDDPDRNALDELEALRSIFQPIRKLMRDHDCKRAIVVAHNAHFDLGFLNAACERADYKRNPFHPFSCFDTATLGGLAFGQTVLARACEAAKIEFNNSKAHSAAYDAEKTAELFCHIVNRWKQFTEMTDVLSDNAAQSRGGII
jgi:ribonuclease T